MSIFDLKMLLYSIIYTGCDSPATNQIASPSLTINNTQREKTGYDGTKHRGRYKEEIQQEVMGKAMGKIMPFSSAEGTNFRDRLRVEKMGRHRRQRTGMGG